MRNKSTIERETETEKIEFILIEELKTKNLLLLLLLVLFPSWRCSP